MKGIRFSSLLLITLLFSVTAYATDISLVSGLGTVSSNTATIGDVDHPWTINENFTGTSPFLLLFVEGSGSGLSPVGPGNETGTSNHTDGRWIFKTVVNSTDTPWISFEIELQSKRGSASTDGDGLSFAQGGGLIFTSDLFSTYTQIDDTKDYLNFHGGTVGINESVTFKFAITDNSNNDPFWLAETPNKKETPEPATLLLFSTGLAGIGLAAWRRKK